MVNLEGQNTGDPVGNCETKIRRHLWSFGYLIISSASLTALLLLFGGSHQYAAFSMNPTSPPCLEWYTEECAGNSSRYSSMMGLTTKILTLSYPQ